MKATTNSCKLILLSMLSLMPIAKRYSMLQYINSLKSKLLEKKVFQFILPKNVVQISISASAKSKIRKIQALNSCLKQLPILQNLVIHVFTYLRSRPIQILLTLVFISNRKLLKYSWYKIVQFMISQKKMRLIITYSMRSEARKST